MNNKELIGELSRRLGYTNKDAARLLTSVTGIMGEELQEGKVIAIQDFGTFEVKKKMERITVNPVTKQRFLVPPKLILNFRPSNLWKERLKKISDGVMKMQQMKKLSMYVSLHRQIALFRPFQRAMIHISSKAVQMFQAVRSKDFA